MSTGYVAPSSPEASSSSSSREAGPLPVKRGEIGYDEAIHGEAMAQMDRDVAMARQPVAMGERHPADRPPSTVGAHEGSMDGAQAGATGTTTTTAAAATTAATTTETTATTDDDSHSTRSSRWRLKRRNRKPLHVGGVTVATLLRLGLQLAVLAGTGVGWAFAAILINRQNAQSQSQAQAAAPATTSPSSTDPDSNSFGLSGSSTLIFVHVAFAIVSIAELIFLERRIFRVRAERYAHKHPGEMLRRGRNQVVDTSMPMVPWQRPPLPTYAAALAQSGARTGDVEDGLIAQPPPPAYGKIRGSTLLLRGFLTMEQSERAHEFDVEAQDGVSRRGSMRSTRTARADAEWQVVPDPQTRPMSYRSVDSAWEAHMDMTRALAVEQALASMEGVPSAHLSDRDRP